MAGEELTPMMRQYRRIKAELPDGVILLFRLGDFYEMFFDDARAAAPILGVALTQRTGTPIALRVPSTRTGPTGTASAVRPPAGTDADECSRSQ